MQTDILNLFVEITEKNYIFFIGKYDNDKNFIKYEEIVIPNNEFINGKLINIDEIKDKVKKNIQLIESKLNFVFKDVILLLDNFVYTCINISGYKKLNGSQILKENISYILNSIKTAVAENEKDKKILHIFNSKSILDNVYIENLPIGLFGDFYSHELTFFLMNNSDLKNIKKIFKENNIRIEKILIKDFIEGIQLIENKSNETFFRIKINENNSSLSFFENSAFKYVEHFPFGTNMIKKDISKVCSISNVTIKKILLDNIFKNRKTSLDNEFLAKEYFDEGKFKKISKKLLIEIANARIEEIVKKIFYNNTNLKYFKKKESLIYVSIIDRTISNNFENDFKFFFSKNFNCKTELFENFETESSVSRTANLLLYGWKKEAIPVAFTKNSLITRIFKSLFE